MIRLDPRDLFTELNHMLQVLALENEMLRNDNVILQARTDELLLALEVAQELRIAAKKALIEKWRVEVKKWRDS
jgi:hypothetical protein